MKVFFDHQAFTQQSYGGISRYIVRLAAELHNMNNEVKIVAPFHRNRYLKELPPQLVKGCELQKYPPKSAKAFSFLNDFLSKGAFCKWRADVIHETYYSSRNKTLKDFPRVVTVHDMTHEKFPNFFSRLDNAALWKKRSVLRADHIICISESTKRDLIEILNVPENKISVVYHGFDKLNIIEGAGVYIGRKPYLLYVGSRGGYKNFEAFLKAFASSPILKKDFNIVAFGGGEFTSAEKNVMSELGLDENQLTQLGGDDHVLGSLYKNAHAFVYPSLYEGFGLPPLEAMAQGCPVFSSNSSSMPEVIGNAGIFFNPNDTYEMRISLENNIYSQEILADLSDKGRLRLSHFSWSKCAKETIEAYSKAI